MAQQINVVDNGDDLSLGPDKCNVCQSDFSYDDEGGAMGCIGLIPVTFCPTCHAGLYDMYTAWYTKDEDDEIVLQSDVET